MGKIKKGKTNERQHATIKEIKLPSVDVAKNVLIPHCKRANK